MKGIRLSKKIVATLVKDQVNYPSRLIIDTFGLIARCGILLILYWYIFKINGGVLNGTTFIFTAWSIFFYFSFSVLRLRDISRLIMQDIQSGNIEVLFSKPMSYLFYRIWWQVGLGVYSFVVINFFATIILILMLGIPSTMTIGIFIPTYILTFIFSAVLSLLLYTVVGLLSFWIDDINPIYWIVDKAVMILGGSYLPIALFPVLMYKIALYSPFGATLFVTHTVSESWKTNWYQLVGIQFIWIVIFVILTFIMFKKAKQRVSVNGG